MKIGSPETVRYLAKERDEGRSVAGIEHGDAAVMSQ